MKRVIVESPYAGKDDTETKRNINYARSCVRDSLYRGEAPFASHLLYTQSGIIDDNIPKEREMGINAGLFLLKDADLTAVYMDLEISKGMEYGIRNAKENEREIEFRKLGENWEEEFEKFMNEHSQNSIW